MGNFSAFDLLVGLMLGEVVDKIIHGDDPALLERVRSTADALRARAGEIRITFELGRRAGVWRISNWR